MPEATAGPTTAFTPLAPAPTSLTSFIGREREVAAVSDLLESGRLVTLTGAGGTGKTRLAEEVMRAVAGRFREGAVWIELAPVTEPTLVAGQIATALGVGGAGRSPTDALKDALRDSERLIVLDNCEQVVDACASVAEQLLRQCPGIRILATSREPLGIPGERAWLVPLLAVPGADDAIDAIAGADAVRLFVDRARAANTSFALTTSNAKAVAQLCRRLDGLPLAIELAAARARAFTPEQMLTRLDDGLRLLADRRGTVARHRTLRDTIAWSYDLLEPNERLVLQRLSVFADELSLDAAEAVCAGDDVPRDEILDRLAALVDKSLVVARDGVDEVRYHLLETIRQFAREQLDASADASTVLARHARLYTDLIRAAEPHFITPNRPEWVDRVARELDDVRLVLTWTRLHDPVHHVELAGRLGWFWYSSGLWTEGRRWLEDALALPEAARRDANRAALLFGAGVVAALQGHGATARTWLEESGAIARELGLHSLAAYSDSYVGVALGQEGLIAAEPPTRAALAWFERTGDLYGQRLALVVLATILLRNGDLAAARAAAEDGVRVARAYGLGRELGIALQILGTVRLHQREPDAAVAAISDALRALRSDPQPFWLARALELLGVAECARGEPLSGARLFGAAERRRERMGAVLFTLDRERLAAPIAAARAAVGDARFEEAWATGRALPFEQVVDDAIAGSLTSQRAPEPAAPLFRVRTLGAFTIERDGVPLPESVWQYTRPRELFAYLLVHPEGRSRDQIAVAFWPEASAAQAKNNFHVTLHHLRRALGRGDIVIFERERYRVNWALGIELDVATFEREVAAGRLREALDLYRGEFLAGESVGDWHLEHRDRLHRVWTDGMAALGAHLLASGGAEEAVEVYRRLVAADELDEDAHRQLMTALAKSGQRGEALRHYERLAQRLEVELGVVPDRRTRELRDRVRRGSLS